ncbi:MAG TPA: carbohydrate porin [Rhizomicrobium sp.]|nr:carbohydrate porin [Rhizomicrobium sp.]
MAGLQSGRHYRLFAAVLLLLGAWGSRAFADDSGSTPADQDWAVHAQVTSVTQFHPAFTSPYRGANSLDPGSRGDETLDMTLFAGVRPWSGGEVWFNPEIDQGFGLSDTYGIAAFPSGAAYKIGSDVPYFRVQRLFFRQTIGLGGKVEDVEPDANQLGGSRTADNLVITLGKFSVVDVFDNNTYAHDPRADFLNWGIIDALAFDYAADSWGYSDGAAAEWTQSWWTLRSGLFATSTVPNGPRIQTDFSYFEIVSEAEERHTLFGRDGKLKILGFLNRAPMGSYDAAVRLGEETHTTPDTALVRNYKSRGGAEMNLEQSITGELGSFLRFSMNDGSQESYEFSDSNRSLSGGLSLRGNEWQRPDDTVGLAFVGDDISHSARAYFADGGLGTLIGDGQLPHYGFEKIVEANYTAQITSWFWAAADYQFVTNPGYNADRGPVSILGMRFHLEF